MIYTLDPEWWPYIKQKEFENFVGMKWLVSKDAPEKIKEKIRELNEMIYEFERRHDFVFEGEDDIA